MLLTSKFSNWLNFVLVMTIKEIKSRYKHSFLGFFWILVQPLFQMLVMGIVFQFFMPLKIENYFVFLFAGLLPWNFFVQSFTRATNAFYCERNLLKKAKFPRESIVLSIIFSDLFQFLIAFCLFLLILLAGTLITGNFHTIQLVDVLSKIPVAVAAILLLTIFITGLSLLTSSLNTRFRDINVIVQLFVSLWFYATPILYSLSFFPASVQPLFYLNPMSTIIELFHFAIFNAPIMIPSLIPIGLSLIFISFYIGVCVFRKESKNFDDWL